MRESERPPVLSCTAARDKTMAGIGGPRCGRAAVHQTSLGTFCDECLTFIRKNYDSSMLALVRAHFEGVKPREGA